MSGRFFTYQSERFPLLLLLPAAFLATLSASLFVTAPTDIPFSFGAYLCSVLVFFGFLALTRIADEHRDLKYDYIHHKDRPVPSGLISLHELRIAGGILAVLMIISSFFVSYRMLIPFAVIGVYYALNSVCFFAKGFILKHTELFIFFRVLTLFFVDFFTVSAQCVIGSFHVELFPALCYLLARLFAFYTLDIALRRTSLQAVGFKKIRHIILFASTFVSFVFFIISLTYLNTTPVFFVISSLGFIICEGCLFFSNTSHRLLRTENFGAILYCLIVALLPCFASRLI